MPVFENDNATTDRSEFFMSKTDTKVSRPERNTLETPISLIKAIRAKCLDCCNWSANEVRLCDTKNCPPFYPFRSGRNPYRTRRDDR